jgi:hypothetical protein
MPRHGENLQEQDNYTGFSHNKEELMTLYSVQLLSKVRHSQITSTVVGSWKNNFKPLPRQLVVEARGWLVQVQRILQH